MKEEDVIPLEQLRAVVSLICSSETCISVGESIQDMRCDFCKIGTPAMTEEQKLGIEHGFLMMTLLDRVVDGLNMPTDDLIMHIQQHREAKEAQQ